MPVTIHRKALQRREEDMVSTYLVITVFGTYSFIIVFLFENSYCFHKYFLQKLLEICPFIILFFMHSRYLSLSPLSLVFSSSHSLYLSLFFSIYPSLYLSISQSLSLSHSLSLSLPHSLYLFMYLLTLSLSLFHSAFPIESVFNFLFFSSLLFFQPQ